MRKTQRAKSVGNNSATMHAIIEAKKMINPIFDR